jgi:hypothetical protein
MQFENARQTDQHSLHIHHDILATSSSTAPYYSVVKLNGLETYYEYQDQSLTRYCALRLRVGAEALDSSEPKAFSLEVFQLVAVENK